MIKDFSAIVLAGGKSSRMGRDKALLPCGGERLIDRVIARLQPYFSQIIVVGMEPAQIAKLPVTAVLDEQPGRGPLMGILSGLRVSNHDHNLVMACDIPDFDEAFLQRMLEGSRDYDILVPRHPDGRHEPLFALYHKGIIPLIEASLQRGIKKIDLIFPECRQGYIDLEGATWLRNINTPTDYADYLGNLGTGVSP
jgi:molybdopterin-guanine dinucleotide biosynthesis protein A